MSDDQQTEKHVSRGTLEKLLKASDRCTTEVGVARQAYGEQLTKACNGGLNRFAFGIVQKLWRKDPAKAAQDIRALNLYIDQLGLNAQLDLEDQINDAEATDTADAEWDAAAPQQPN